MKLITRSEWGARPPRSTTAMGSRLRGVALHWEGPRMGTPVHANAFSDRALDVTQIAAAIAVLHRTYGEEHTGERNVALSQLTAPTQAQFSAAFRVVSAADCYGLVAGIQAYHMDAMGWNDTAYNAIVCPHGFTFVCRGPGVRSGANGDAEVNATHYAVCYLGGEGDPFTDEARDADEDVYRWLFETDDLGAFEWVGHRDLTSTACPGPDRYEFAHGAHPWRGGSTTKPDPPEEDEMSQAVNIALDLAKGEQAREVGLPSPKNSGAIAFGDVHGSFSVGVSPDGVEASRELLARNGTAPFEVAEARKQVGLVVVKHRNDGTGIGVPAQDPAGIVWVPVGSGRHGHFDVEPGEESVQVALADVPANPAFAVVDLLFEIGK